LWFGLAFAVMIGADDLDYSGLLEDPFGESLCKASITGSNPGSLTD
jgi:hypothetical protein